MKLPSEVYVNDYYFTHKQILFYSIWHHIIMQLSSSVQQQILNITALFRLLLPVTQDSP